MLGVGLRLARDYDQTRTRDSGSARADVGRLAKGAFSIEGSRVPPPLGRIAGAGPPPVDGGSDGLVEERVHRMEEGARLWGATFVPPVEPARRLELIDKWSGNARRRRSNTSSSQEVRVR